MSTVWLHEVCSEEGLRFRIGRRGATRIAEWDGLLRLEAEEGQPPRIEASGQSLAVRKLRQGAVPALLGHLNGRLHWHGAACAWARGASILALGQAGAGKSTLVAGLCGATGASFLSDDVAAIAPAVAGWELHRSEDKHAMRADMAVRIFGHTTQKKALFAPSRMRKRARLGAIVSLQPGALLALEPLRSREKLRILNQNLVRFALDDEARLQRDLDVVIALAEQVPVYSLVCPRPFDDWHALADLLRPRLRGVLGIGAE